MTSQHAQSTRAPAWEDANQRALTAEMQRVYRALQRYRANVQGETADVDEPKAAASEPWQLPTPPALDQISTLFRLSPFERDLLLLCAGVELDARFPALCAEVQGDPQRAFASFSMALAALPQPHWSALTPAGSLRRWRLIEVGTSHILTQCPLRISERVLHYLTGVQQLDERLAGFVRPLTAANDLAPSQQALAAQLAAAWSRAAGERMLPVAQLCGTERAGKRAVAGGLCRARAARVCAARRPAANCARRSRKPLTAMGARGRVEQQRATARLRRAR